MAADGAGKKIVARWKLEESSRERRSIDAERKKKNSLLRRIND